MFNDVASASGFKLGLAGCAMDVWYRFCVMFISGALELHEAFGPPAAIPSIWQAPR